jgi:hypothetical protein
MYGPTSSCLPDKYLFGIARAPSQLADCLAGFTSLRPVLTNQPGLSEYPFLTKSADANFLAGGYHDRSGKFDNGVPVSEKPCIPSSGTNSYPCQQYSDDPPTQMPGPMAQVQVSLSVPKVTFARC